MSLFGSSAGDLDDNAAGEGSFFSHSARNFHAIVAEKERNKRQRAERQRATVERRDSSRRNRSDEPGEEEAGGGLKKRRRRESQENRRRGMQEDSVQRMLVSPPPPVDDEVQWGEDRAAGHGLSPSPRRSARKMRDDADGKAGLWTAAAATTVIDLDGPGSEAEGMDKPTTTQAASTGQQMEEDSDEEFAEMARRARARQALKKQASKTPDTARLDGTPGSGAADVFGRLPPEPELPDPVVRIFITSPIPDTKPLMVLRKLSQRLQDVRLAWCGRQGFFGEAAKDVFLTFRMRKLYDVSTCKSLGLEADAAGNLVLKGAEGRTGIEKLHLEAVTEDLLVELKAARVERERVQRLEDGVHDWIQGTTEIGATLHPPSPPVEEEKIIRLVLQARNRPDFKVKAKSVSPVVRSCMSERRDCR